jgi:hypothetical protein
MPAQRRRRKSTAAKPTRETAKTKIANGKTAKGKTGKRGGARRRQREADELAGNDPVTITKS